DRIAQSANGRQARPVLQYLVAHAASLRDIRVEPRVAARPMDRERQLPGEVEGVLHSRVHAFAAGWAMNVSRVAGQEHAPCLMAATFRELIRKLDNQIGSNRLTPLGP